MNRKRIFRSTHRAIVGGRYKALVLTAALSLWLLAAVSSAQPFPLRTEASSPLWWPLADDVSIDDLRETYLNVEANTRRYEEAVAAGLEAAPVDAEIAFYIHPRANPELVTMWQALDKLYIELVVMNRVGELPTEDLIVPALRSYSLSQASIDLLLLALNDFYESAKQAREESFPMRKEYHEMLRELRRRLREKPDGLQALAQAERNRDARALAALVGKRETRIADLMQAYYSDAPYQSRADLLVQLQAALPLDDWKRLRAFLRGSILPRLGPSIATSEEVER